MVGAKTGRLVAHLIVLLFGLLWLVLVFVVCQALSLGFVLILISNLMATALHRECFTFLLKIVSFVILHLLGNLINQDSGARFVFLLILLSVLLDNFESTLICF